MKYAYGVIRINFISYRAKQILYRNYKLLSRNLMRQSIG